MRALSPSTIRPPLARYSHGLAVPANHRLVITAGQLGIDLEGKIPADSEGQAEICFANIAAILAEDGMTMENVIRLSVYVTAREHMEGYPPTIPVAPMITRFFWPAVTALVSNSEALIGPFRFVAVMRVRASNQSAWSRRSATPRTAHLHGAASPHARSSRSSSIGIESASA